TCSYAQDTLKVMTYNIYHGEQAYQEGESNLEDVASLINKVDPDFVALQEVDSLTHRSGKFNKGDPEDLIQTLADLTNRYGYFGKAISYDGGGYGEGILSKKAFKSRKLMLPIPKGGEDRAVVMLEAQTETGRRFLFAGTHLCHQYSENRLAQVEKINNYFKKVADPIIIGGDFNFTPEREPYKKISSLWRDAAVLSGNTNPTISYEEPTHRIDYLFLSKKSNWKVLDLNVLK